MIILCRRRLQTPRAAANGTGRPAALRYARARSDSAPGGTPHARGLCAYCTRGGTARRAAVSPDRSWYTRAPAPRARPQCESQTRQAQRTTQHGARTRLSACGARSDSARWGTPRGCAHSPRRPLLNSGLLKPVLVHSPPVIRARSHNESQTGASAADHTEQHTHKHIPRARSDYARWGRPRGAVRTHGDSPPTHPSPRAARARAGGTHRARAATRAGAARGPALLPYHAPVLGAPRTPAGVSGTLHAPFCLASARARGRATAPGAQLLRRGTGGLRRASFELRPSPGTPGPPHPHTECRASLCRQCAQVPPGWLGRGAPPLGKRVFYSHQGNSHKTRCEAPRCGRKHPPARA